MHPDRKQHSEGSAYIGNTSICAPASSIISSLPCSHPLSSPPLSSPFSLSFLFLFLSVSFPLPPLPLHPCLSFLAFSLCLDPPSPLLLCIPQSPPDIVIHLHWGDTCAVLTVRPLTEWEEGKQQPHDSKTHYRWENTSDHQLLKPIQLHQQFGY